MGAPDVNVPSVIEIKGQQNGTESLFAFVVDHSKDAGSLVAGN